MNLIIPSIIQAITEAMPISSTAHLSLLSLLSLQCISYNIIIQLHLCTAIGAFIYTFSYSWKLLCSFFAALIGKRNEYTQIMWILFSITLIQVILSFPAKYLLNILEVKPYYQFLCISIGAIVSGIILLFANKTKQIYSLLDLNNTHIWKIALIQSIAFFPGVSRLGAALIALRYLMFDVKHSWIIAIILGIPLSIGAFTFSFIAQPVFILTPMIVAFITLLSYTIYFLSITISLKIYAYYKILFGFFVLYFLIF